MDKHHLNVFEGENALLHFHNPHNQPYVALVELPPELNPYRKSGVRIFVKLMNMLPLANVKSIAAYNMLEHAHRSGALEGVSEVVEASSGNTVLSLTAIARAFSIQKTRSLISHEISQGKLDLLRLFGTTPVVYKEPICADPNDIESRLHKAREFGKLEGMYNPDQYSNPRNPSAHENLTGPQIWKQSRKQITLFVSSLGTTGTMLGTAKFLKGKNPKIATVGGIRKPNNLVPGLRTRNLLKEIGHNWKQYVDFTYEIGTVASYKHSLNMIRYGLFVGPSSGLALATLLDFLEVQQQQNNLNKYRNKNDEVYAVFIAYDTPSPYVHDYFRYLPESDFPEIVNKELLEKNPYTYQTSYERYKDIEVDTISAFSQIYPYTVEEITKKTRDAVDIQLRPGNVIIDVRTNREFEETHLYSSENIPIRELEEAVTQFAKDFKGHTVYVYCTSGNTSKTAAYLLRKHKITAYSITGGLAEWSLRNLPRYSKDFCITT